MTACDENISFTVKEGTVKGLHNVVKFVLNFAVHNIRKDFFKNAVILCR